MEPIGKSMRNVTNRPDFQKRLSGLKEQVLADPDIQAFLSANSSAVDESVIERSLNKLYEYTQQSKGCRDCPSIGQCRNIIQGYHPELVLQGKTIDLQYDQCPSKIADDQRKKHESLIKSLYIPKDILKAQFQDIDFDDNSRIKLFGLIQEFVRAAEEGKRQRGVYLHGSFGVGKTFIMGAIANELAFKNIPSMLVYLPEFMRELKNSIQNSTLEEKMDAVKKVKVLMLDDIGAESMSSWTRDEILGVILQYRMTENLPTFFTSNFDLKELEHHLSYTQRGEEEKVKAARVIERIKYLATPFKLEGGNRRS
ncbi:primosomal protein DnaI [Bacillus mangrovi]|uniref:Primosomal protein DnaI n=1 Tax=Metabacillus mangrovi TaxID=1491830 RepID=A0A7X2S3B6_9BACI|nr:primosomal protein DnaI [Metabacillus mangrovi]MTH52892.1 primosomal protein DnaI [Metabacillus mangrovi]